MELRKDFIYSKRTYWKKGLLILQLRDVMVFSYCIPVALEDINPQELKHFPIYHPGGLICADDKPYAPSSQVYQEKAKSLGIHFTPLEVSLKDTVESLKGRTLSVSDSWYLMLDLQLYHKLMVLSC
ncbi:hypothetical protein AAG906_024721 [Vitis piasezkii]